MDDPPYDDPAFADELGRTIRLLRIDRRLERRELADQAGISYSYLSAIENGGKAPSARLLYSLGRALGVRDDQLLAMARQRMAAAAGARPASLPPPGPAVAAAAPAAEPPRRRKRRKGRPAAAEELTALLEQLDPDDAAAVLDLARRLAGK